MSNKVEVLSTLFVCPLDMSNLTYQYACSCTSCMYPGFHCG